METKTITVSYDQETVRRARLRMMSQRPRVCRDCLIAVALEDAGVIEPIVRPYHFYSRVEVDGIKMLLEVREAIKVFDDGRDSKIQPFTWQQEVPASWVREGVGA
jgi:hypothetical protein